MNLHVRMNEEASMKSVFGLSSVEIETTRR